MTTVLPLPHTADARPRPGGIARAGGRVCRPPRLDPGVVKNSSPTYATKGCDGFG